MTKRLGVHCLQGVGMWLSIYDWRQGALLYEWIEDSPCKVFTYSGSQNYAQPTRVPVRSGIRHGSGPLSFTSLVVIIIDGIRQLKLGQFENRTAASALAPVNVTADSARWETWAPQYLRCCRSNYEACNSTTAIWYVDKCTSEIFRSLRQQFNASRN